MIRAPLLNLRLEWLWLTLPLTWLGIGRTFPFSLLGERGVTAGTAFWFLITLVWCIGTLLTASSRNATARAARSLRPGVLIAVAIVMTPILDIASWKAFGRLGYGFPTLPLIVDGVSAATFAAYAFFRRKQGLSLEPSIILAIAAFASLSHLAASIVSFPLAPERSDMLPMIKLAGERFLDGQTAYGARLNDAYPLPYPPLLWIAYLPASLLEIDLRWIAGIFRGILVWLLWKNLPAPQDPRRLYAALWLISPFLMFRHDIYQDVYWAALVGVLILIQKGRWRSAAALTGAKLAILQWSWIIAPFLVLASVRGRQIRNLVAASTLAASVAAAIYVPIYWQERSGLVDGVLANIRLIGSQIHFAELCLGLSGPFVAQGLSLELAWVQRALLVVTGSIALGLWVKRPDQNLAQPILMLALVTQFAFTLISPLIENYFYLTPWLMAALIAPVGTLDPGRKE